MPTHSGVIYQFGPFAVDAGSGEILKNGTRVKLQEQPFRLLVVLLENAGEVVTREELRARLWPQDTFVDFDSSLRVAVRKLREALQDSAEDPRFIETIPKRGYRFLVPEVRRVNPAQNGATLLDPGVLETDLQAAPVRWSPNRLSKYWVAGIAVLLLGVCGILLRHQRAQAKPLTDTDVLVLSDFANNTGDPVFDGTLRQALAIQLEQSPFLKIMDDEQMQHTLRLMNMAPGARITHSIAHDICVREAVAAIIEGSISSLGKNYVITLQAITCQGGVTLAREQLQVGDKEHVLATVGSAATSLRARLGESRGTIQKLNRPLEEVTTGSPEALQNYTTGFALLSEGRFLAARPLFERAIALDPDFAMAYYANSLAFNNAGDADHEAEYKRNAFSLVSHVSDIERDHIAGGYYELTGELDKAIDVYQLGNRNYPRSWHFPNFLSDNYISMGNLEDGLKEGQTAQQLQPDAEPPYRRLLDAYMSLDRLDEARKVRDILRARHIGGARIHQRFLEMAYIEGDQTAVNNEIQWYAGKPEEYLSFGLQAADRNGSGQRRESRILYLQAAESAMHGGFASVASGYQEADAMADVLAGNCKTSRHLGRPALALALCGDTIGAENLATEMSRRYPNGTLWNSVQLPAIRAAIELDHGEPAKALQLLAFASPYERAYPQVPYIRGLIYLRLHRGKDAAAEFRKIAEHKGANWASTWRYPNWGLYYSLSYLGLARSLALVDDTVGAKDAFGRFFVLWKDADHDLPILIQARADYAALR